jgi:trk system potassium uptake protein TrkH
MDILLRPLALLAACYGALIALAGLIGLGAGDASGWALLLTAVVMAFLAGASRLAAAGKPTRLGRDGALLVLGGAWLMAVVLATGATKIVTGASLVDSLFEAVSALTLTGATVLPPPESLPLSFVVARALTAWFGAVLTLAGIGLALAPAGLGGLAGQGDNTVAATSAVLKLFILITALCFIALALMGLPLTHALVLASSAASTSGYTLQADAVIGNVPLAGLAVIGVTMAAAATSLAWQVRLLARNSRPHEIERETRLVLGSILVLATVIFAATTGHGAWTGEGAGRALFAAVSLVSTTGFQLAPGHLAEIPMALVILIILVGGAGMSLTGGIKTFRADAMGRQAVRELERLVFPNQARPRPAARDALSIQVLKAIWTLMALWMLVLVAVAFAVSPDMPDFASAYSAAIAAMSNTGPVYPLGFADGAQWPAYADLSSATKLILAAAMLVGRLEVLVMVVFGLMLVWRR